MEFSGRGRDGGFSRGRGHQGSFRGKDQIYHSESSHTIGQNFGSKFDSDSFENRLLIVIFSDSTQFRGRGRGGNNFSGQKSFQHNFSNQGSSQASANYTPQQNRGRGRGSFQHQQGPGGGGSSIKDRAHQFMNSHHQEYGQSDHQDTGHRLQLLANYGGQTSEYNQNSARGQQSSVQKGWHHSEESQFHGNSNQNSNFSGNNYSQKNDSNYQNNTYNNLNRPRPPKRPMRDERGYGNNQGSKIPVKRQFTTWDLPQMDPSLPPEIKALCTSAKCHLCEVTITSYNLCFMHYAGKSHAKKVKAKMEANIMTNPPNNDQILALLGIQEPLPDEIMAKLTIQKCHFCQTTFPSMEIAKMHYKGTYDCRSEY